MPFPVPPARRPPSLGEGLKALRLRRGLTQNELAERVGMGQTEISRIENGHTNATYETLHKMASALGAEILLHVPKGPSTLGFPEEA